MKYLDSVTYCADAIAKVERWNRIACLLVVGCAFALALCIGVAL